MELIGHKLVGSGKKKVLVMHNWMADSTCYDPLLPYLDKENFTYLFVDLRGYGSSKEIEGEYSLEEATKDAVKVVNYLLWEKFHVIGHSMSGMIAQKIAVDHVFRVESIVAITPVPASGSRGPEQLMRFLEKAAQSSDENAIGCVNLLTSHRYFNSFAKKIVRDWRNCSISEARVGYLKMFSHTDFSSSVVGLATPMLIIFGEHDLKGSEDSLRDTFLKWYPNARMECCKGSGHYPMLETPVYLASMICKALQRNSDAITF